MYLVHARLRMPAGGGVPPGLAEMIHAHAREADALEHVSVHGEESGEVTVGVFSLAAGLAEAEERAADLLVRAVDLEPQLAGSAVLSVGAALVPGPWWDFD
ncbi:hypothetical protein ACFVT9_15695 [Kitasatospora cineracea]|uniref:hypothetical protein n=1 Tax=Kitasatospora TaxID=2063 RepID=UPI0004C30C95|nr:MULTISPECIES: hypothetical protein [unclassified Kitasatospora]WAL73178.1 hypothetical protein OU787_17680 [Kitasatospora sp. YST-16]WNW39231.1 hypothetical protein RKE32_17640 [Streptomyces sp. Li-HN-5-13]